MSYFSEQRLLDSTPVTTVLNQVHTMMLAHPAWSHVEDSTDGGSTVRTYMCDGTLNGTGYTFYVHLSNSAQTSPIYLRASEGWDTGTKKLIRGCVNPANTYAPEATYNSGFGATGYAASDSRWNPYTYFYCDTSNFTYWVLLTATGLWIGTGQSPFYQCFAGLFEPFWEHPNEFPLIQGPIGNNDTDAAASFSRRPSETGTSWADMFAAYAHADTTSMYSPYIGSVPTAAALYDKAYGARLMAYATVAATNGSVRGLWRDLLVFAVSGAVAKGDTIDVGGSTYVCIYVSAGVGYFIDTEAP